MHTVNMLEAKSNLSRLVNAIESGVEAEIVIARNGRPAAKLVPVRKRQRLNPIGIAKGKFTAPDDIDRDEEYIIALFEGRAE